MAIDKTEWVQRLKAGDSVSTTYNSTTPFVTKVEYVLTKCQTESGLGVKLEGIDIPLDIFWIFPHIS